MKKQEENKNMDWEGGANREVHNSEWFGAIIRYFWYLGRRKFDTFYNPKELKTNVAIGWSIKVVLVLVLIYVGYKYSS